jgi:NAD(P)-dependent dehydrogenase (short-subunit alcohol dehydrogenase family)
LSDRVAFVTGAVGGIGSAIVDDFLMEGAKVILCDIKAEVVAARVAEMRAAGHPVAGVGADIADHPALKAAVAPAVEALGAIDIVVANASIGGRSPSLDRTTPDGFRDDIARNLAGQFNTVDVAIEGMKRLNHGSIVLVGSVNGLTSLGQPAYSAAKAALISYARTMATEYGAHNIRANIVCPGTVRTPAWDARVADDPNLMDRLKRWYPLNRLGTPMDIAKAVTFLASDDARFISGAMLPVDGGLMAGNLMMGRELTRQTP